MTRGWEAALKIAKVILAGATALFLISSAALAQQSQTGIVTKVDRINGIARFNRRKAVLSERIPAALPKTSKHKMACR